MCQTDGETDTESQYIHVTYQHTLHGKNYVATIGFGVKTARLNTKHK